MQEFELISEGIKTVRVRDLEKKSNSPAKANPEKTWANSLCDTSFDDIFQLAPEKTEYLLPPIIGKGKLVLLTGKAKLGKTRFVLSLLKNAAEGKDYLGQKQEPVKCLYLSEMDRGTMADYLKRYGFRSPDCKFSYFADAPKIAWEEKIRIITEACLESGIQLVVIDTLFRFAEMSEDSINDYASMNKIMEPLIKAKESGLSILVVHHDRKGAGDPLSNALGSVAITGSVDDVIALTSDGKGSDYYTLTAVGRSIGKPVEISLKNDPTSIYISFQKASEPLQETSETGAINAAENAVVTVLRSIGRAQKKDLLAALEEVGSPYSPSTIDRCLKRLKGLGKISASVGHRPFYSLPS